MSWIATPMSFLLGIEGCTGAKSVTLRTHCGVLSATVDGKLWLAAPPLSDGSGNPPPGWGENGTAGAWRQEGGTQATFRSNNGKVAHFVLARPGAKDPAAGCE
jgi:hypothetical protein